MPKIVELTFYRGDTHEKLGTWFVLSSTCENFEVWMHQMGFYRPRDDQQASKFINSGNDVYVITDEEQVIRQITERERW